MSTHPTTTGKSPNRPLLDFIDSTDDPFVPNRFASPSPFANHGHEHRNPNYRGVSPQSIGTSILVADSDDTDGSLPGRDSSVDTLAISSVHSSVGEREMSRRLRTLDIDGYIRPQPVLQCPFRLHGCQLDYSNFDDWFWHSVTHFYTNGSRLASGPAIVMPPTRNRCCFCSKEFFNINGIRSWLTRMDHVAYHHEIGHSLSHARADFQLLAYLWENHLIDEIEYRELKGNTPDRSRLIHGNPSPPTSDTADSPPSTPTAEESRPVAVVNERRRDRRPQPPPRRHRNNGPP